MALQQKQREPIKAAPTFKDGADRVWCVNLTLGLIDDVLAQTKIDLLPDDNDPSAVTGLLFNQRKLGAVLWEICRSTAESAGVDRTTFLNGLDGATITRGWGALVDGIYFFIQSSSKKIADQWMALVEAQMRVVEAGAVEVANAVESEETSLALQQAIASIGDELKREIKEGLANSVTSSQPSQGSIRERIRSGS